MKLTLSIRSGQVGGLKRGLEHTFDEAGGVIGRNASCDWQIEDATRTLSGRHATITFRDGHFYITDTSTNGVFVGGSSEPLGRGRSVEINQGMRLNFGDYAVVATVQEDGRFGDNRATPRMSIAPETPSRGLSTDPLDMLGEGTDHAALSVAPDRARTTAFQSAPKRAGEGGRRGKDDTLGSFFGTSAPQRKDDPFSDLGRSSTSTPGGSSGGRVGTDWLSADTEYDGANSTAYAPQLPPEAVPDPVKPTDLGSRLSDALASELGEPIGEPVRQSVRQIHRDATEITSYAHQAPSPPQGGNGREGDAALPHDLSWEDLLGAAAPAAARPGGSITPMTPSASGQAVVPPLPPMEDLLGPPAAAGAATSVPHQPIGRDPTSLPTSSRTSVTLEPDANPARRPRRAPGNDLLSDLVMPATGGSQRDTPPAGNSLDPVSVLRERASHRAATTQYAAEPPAPVAAPTPTPAVAAVGGSAYDAVLMAAGIDPATVAEADREAVACEIGRTAKAAASGLVDVLAARRLFKEEFRLDRTRIRPEKNNPFKFFKTGAEALSKGASDTETGFLPLSAGMKEGFNELKAHELASVTAMQEAIATVLAKLDPASIQAEDAAGGFFGRGDGKALWERYKDLHAGLAQDPEATSRKIVSEQFLRAYEKTLATLRAKDRS